MKKLILLFPALLLSACATTTNSNIQPDEEPSSLAFPELTASKHASIALPDLYVNLMPTIGESKTTVVGEVLIDFTLSGVAIEQASVYIQQNSQVWLLNQEKVSVKKMGLNTLKVSIEGTETMGLDVNKPVNLAISLQEVATTHWVYSDNLALQPVY